LQLPARARALVGSAVALPVESDRHDCVLMQMLVHHLAEENFATTRARVVQSFREAHRVLCPGGKLVVLESVMPTPLVWMQQLAFPLTRWILARMRHPLVFQWTSESLRILALEAGFATAEAKPVPRGRWMIFLGRRMPTWLVPVRFSKIIACKAA
jgi:ubiquinone/menaquinone biosynthesis C-methylase UbiE